MGRRKRGSAIAFVLIFLIIFAAFSIAMVQISTGIQKLSATVTESRSLDYYAEVGANYWVSQLNRGELSGSGSPSVSTITIRGRDGEVIQWSVDFSTRIGNDYYIEAVALNSENEQSGRYRFLLRKAEPATSNYGIISGSSFKTDSIPSSPSDYLELEGVTIIGTVEPSPFEIAPYTTTSLVGPEAYTTTSLVGPEAFINSVSDYLAQGNPSLSTQVVSDSQASRLAESVLLNLENRFQFSNVPVVNEIQDIGWTSNNNLTVEGGGTLTLSSGKYYAQDITVKKGATLILDATSGPVYISAKGLKVEEGGKVLIKTGDNTPDLPVLLRIQNGGDATVEVRTEEMELPGRGRFIQTVVGGVFSSDPNNWSIPASPQMFVYSPDPQTELQVKLLVNELEFKNSNFNMNQYAPPLVFASGIAANNFELLEMKIDELEVKVTGMGMGMGMGMNNPLKISGVQLYGPIVAKTLGEIKVDAELELERAGHGMMAAKVQIDPSSNSLAKIYMQNIPPRLLAPAGSWRLVWMKRVE